MQHAAGAVARWPQQCWRQLNSIGLPDSGRLHPACGRQEENTGIRLLLRAGTPETA